MIQYQGYSEGNFANLKEQWRGYKVYQDSETKEYFTLENNGYLGVDARDIHSMIIDRVRDYIILKIYGYDYKTHMKG